MKAKIIKTGEIVEVYHEPQHGQVSNIYKESVFVNGRLWQENELEFIEPKDVDLEKELDKYTANNFWALDGNNESPYLLEKDDMLKVAKYFYELGLKTQKGE